MPDALDDGGRGGYFGNGANAVAAAKCGSLSAALQAGTGPGHMVIASPVGNWYFPCARPVDRQLGARRGSLVDRAIRRGGVHSDEHSAIEPEGRRRGRRGSGVLSGRPAGSRRDNFHRR